MTESTTIRVSPDTRDRLNTLAAERGFTNVDSTVSYLLDERWKAQCIADADRWREQDPEGWREHLDDTDQLGSLPDGLDGEPYEDVA